MRTARGGLAGKWGRADRKFISLRVTALFICASLLSHWFLPRANPSRCQKNPDRKPQRNRHRESRCHFWLLKLQSIEPSRCDDRRRHLFLRLGAIRRNILPLAAHLEILQRSHPYAANRPPAWRCGRSLSRVILALLGFQFPSL